MNKIRIYHNPRCSKSRETLLLLENQQQDIEIVEYLKTPPTAEELSDILQQLDMQPRQLLRTKETLYKELQLDNKDLSDQELIRAMCDNPKLIERPIVIKNNQAIIGRPPEAVLNIL
ncbi:MULTISPECIES: arsenate reductase (glutaredoxin) [unclassified Methylophaga]|jgi:arsenate reductase|uniref:arsenate reductase (glutaredoxin) n=1 Tax=unclassified Methylophaga TaxID=2629249 RepID=UPI000C53D1F9|nr:MULTISPECIES: arsenate reductase (glutaredoxin) [unclassified Methylophaga]MAL49523.1 arsenate reductase (glutaredoxin) [Methylophaga sp.]MAP27181.1 arsenate reductase (glutaredoxin) [Methylophaga sp.]MBP24367.1 arsenate reductase (glutaredoxin) [Methylophaga sp.]HAD32222.1 arsenate reductase (glutaredoxin) [Methylophaga sp.]HBX60933.1 arsenate reductase (glutaredoxin) [Methylophaga sp.]|tara:strand:- start:8386 stop:8736 length:351 start_codon:yes stop_codon:yes gene_type:complete